MFLMYHSVHTSSQLSKLETVSCFKWQNFNYHVWPVITRWERDNKKREQYLSGGWSVNIIFLNDVSKNLQARDIPKNLNCDPFLRVIAVQSPGSDCSALTTLSTDQ